MAVLSNGIFSNAGNFDTTSGCAGSELYGLHARCTDALHEVRAFPEHSGKSAFWARRNLIMFFASNSCCKLCYAQGRTREVKREEMIQDIKGIRRETREGTREETSKDVKENEVGTLDAVITNKNRITRVLDKSCEFSVILADLRNHLVLHGITIPQRSDICGCYDRTANTRVTGG